MSQGIPISHFFFNLTNENLHPLSTSLPLPLLPLTICSIQQMENFHESEKKPEWEFSIYPQDDKWNALWVHNDEQMWSGRGWRKFFVLLCWPKKCTCGQSVCGGLKARSLDFHRELFPNRKSWKMFHPLILTRFSWCFIKAYNFFSLVAFAMRIRKLMRMTAQMRECELSQFNFRVQQRYTSFTW